MFRALGRGVARYPWVFVAVWLIVVIVAGLGAFWGYGHDGLFARMSNSQSLVTGSESDTVNNLTRSTANGESVTVVVTGVPLASQQAQVAAFMAPQVHDLSAVPGVAQVVNPLALLGSGDPTLQAQANALISTNQDGCLLIVTLGKNLDKAGTDATHAALKTAVDGLSTVLDAQYPGASAAQVSTALISDTIVSQVASDLVIGETVSLPVALVLLIIVFGGLVAAGLPLIGALVSIVGGLGAVWALTFVTGVDSFILNVLSIIGVALSIDYGLLVVSRYREELAARLAAAGYPDDGSRVPRRYAARSVVREAVAAAVATAGRTVTFSAVTIAFALSALLVIPSELLHTIAIAGVVVTVLAVLVAIMVVPSLIVIANRVLIRPSVLTRIPGLRAITRATGDLSSDHGLFSRLAKRVHRHPWLFMGAVVVILAVMASPIANLTMRTEFSDYLPPGAPTTKAYNVIQDNYPAMRAATIVVVADVPPSQTSELATHLQGLAHVDYVSRAAPLPADTNRSAINVHLDYANQVGTEVTDQVKALRSYDAGYPLLIGGAAALQLDFVSSILNHAGEAGGIMAAAVFLLLFLMTGSVIVPLKALIINSLSLVASLGTTSWIFAHGYLGMPKALGMETFIVACAVSFGFGLAMDYEVFLLARIKEGWDAGLPNDEAVERGLQRSGRIITSAAAIIVAVFIGFTFGHMLAIKQIGVALAVTVITDATLVRLLLVPATMTVLGQWNWWAPKPLRWLYQRVGVLH